MKNQLVIGFMLFGTVVIAMDSAKKNIPVNPVRGPQQNPADRGIITGKEREQLKGVVYNPVPGLRQNSANRGQKGHIEAVEKKIQSLNEQAEKEKLKESNPDTLFNNTKNKIARWKKLSSGLEKNALKDIILEKLERLDAAGGDYSIDARQMRKEVDPVVVN